MVEKHELPGCRTGRPASACRRGERGAALTLFAFVASVLLVALGGAYLAASEHVFRLSLVRERQAKARAAADAALVLALEAGGPERPTGEAELDGAKLSWEASALAGGRGTVRATGTFLEGADSVTHTLVAEVEWDPSKPPRILRVTPP